jgi:hypothetical protein
VARKRTFIPPIERVNDGFAINIDADERQLVSRLLEELSELLLSGTDDNRLIRMFPPAYHLADDADADAEYQRLMREDLVASRLAGITTVNQALATTGIVGEETIVAFTQAINGLRLVIGTMLDVGEDHDPDAIDSDDPQIGSHHLYNFLSWLLDWAVQALSQPVRE